MPAPDLTKDDPVTRLARVIGAKSIRQMCSMLGISRYALYRAIGGDAAAIAKVKKQLGESGSRVLFEGAAK